MLLNVGPMPTGEIAPEQVQLLEQMGAWLAKYGESIYGTRGGPFKPGMYGVSTRKGTTIYLHITQWIDDALELPPLSMKVVGSRVLTGGQVQVDQTESGIHVSVPKEDHKPVDTIVALELDGPACDLVAADVPGQVPLSTGARATASNVYQGQAAYGPDKAVDGRDDTRWATDGGITHAWLELDLGKPETFSRFLIHQAYPQYQRVRKFAIEYWQDDQWKVCYQGQNLGQVLSGKVPAITAQRVRLNITEATDGPTIWEFQLYR